MLTAFVSDTTMAPAEDGEVLGSRQLDMGNSSLIWQIANESRTKSPFS